MPLKFGNSYIFLYFWIPLASVETAQHLLIDINCCCGTQNHSVRVPTGRFLPSLKAAWNKRLSGFNAKNPTFNGSPTFVYNGGEVLAKLQVMAKQCWVCFEVPHDHFFSLDRKHPKKQAPTIHYIDSLWSLWLQKVGGPRWRPLNNSTLSSISCFEKGFKYLVSWKGQNNGHKQ